MTELDDLMRTIRTWAANDRSNGLHARAFDLESAAAALEAQAATIADLREKLAKAVEDKEAARIEGRREALEAAAETYWTANGYATDMQKAIRAIDPTTLGRPA